MSQIDAPDTASADRGTRSTRNPRRRARPDSESIKVAPRRKRSKITETTFLPREDAHDDEAEVDSMNGHATHPPARSNGLRKPSSSSAMNGALDIPVRSRSGARRVTRVDPATILSQNENYSIKLLPNTPRELRRHDVEFRGSIDAQSNLALAITYEKVYIWDHTGHGGSSSTKVVDIPPEISAHGSIPFGALVAGGPGSDLGLVLISSHSDKVLYHESVNRITSQSFFSERKDGVTGSIHGLFSGEHTIQLVSAHPAGFVAVMNSGRMAHFTLRDPQGRPKIQSQILYANEQGGGGIFSSIKSILGAQSWKQAISAVRTRSLERGQVQVLALLEKGELRAWNVDWSGHHEYQYSVDFREQLREELRQMRSAEAQSHVDELSIVDLAITERPNHSSSQELVAFNSDRPVSAMVLVQCGPPNSRCFHIVQLSLQSTGADIRRILTLNSTDEKDSAFHPQLRIPAPYNTAFVVRSTSITVLSLLATAANPEAQLHEASYIEPEPYQDTVFLRQRNGHAILGAGIDTTRQTADVSSIVFVQGSGLLKFSVNAVPQQQQAWEVAKSRLEQAIFYGVQDGNVLDLLQHAGTRPSVDDVDRAALELSTEIFTSTSTFLDVPPVSVESSLNRRATALYTLAETLQKAYAPLSRTTMWRLLMQAEKTAAGIHLWSLYERSMLESKTKKIANLWQEIMQCIDDKHPFQSIYEGSATEDLIRTFFVTQLDRLPDILEFACRVMILVAATESDATADTAIRIASEADNIWIGALETVFQFRMDNAALYGISPTKLDEGIILQPADLQDVDEPWTSAGGLLKQIAKMIEEAQQLATDAYEAVRDPEVEQLVEKIAADNSKLVEISCLMFRERISWCISCATPPYTDQAEKLQIAYETTRHAQIRALANVGQAQAGLRLAEKYHDMATLTTMIIAESQWLYENLLGAPLAERHAINVELEKNNERVSRYFDLYGDDFSEAFFGHSFASGRTGHMLSQAQARWNEPLTKYLRKDPSRGKVCWINDVLHGQDLVHAGDTLLDVATSQEQNVWSKTVELSLAKLSMYASSDKASGRFDTALQDVDKELSFMSVQDRLYDHIHPATYHSLDAEAAVKDALSSFARGVHHAYPLHFSLLGDLIEKVLDHKTLALDELIDVLTLTDADAGSRQDKDLDRSETFEALLALYSSPRTESTTFDLLLKLIWKRAFLQEDWEELNAIASKDGDTAARDFLTQSNLFQAVYSIFDAKVASEEDRFQVLTPEETLGADTSIGELPKYVPSDVAEHFLEENIKMDQELERVIKEQRLNSWLPDIVRFAKDAVWAAAEDQGTDLQWGAEDTSLVNGHGANGYANGIKTEETDDQLIQLDELNGDSTVL